MARKMKHLIEQESNEEGRDLCSTKPDLLDVLLTASDADGNELSYKEIRDEIASFLYKGHNCVGPALLWSLYSLAKYRDIQMKVYHEVSRVIGDGEVEWQHLSELQYLQCVIQEVLRVHTVVPVIDRTLDTTMDIDDVRLEPGTKVQLNLHAANHNPHVWDNCEEFRPKRFMDEENNRNNLDYLPFSAGSRCCLGRHFTMVALQVVLARILQSFHIELDTSRKVKPAHLLGHEATNGIKVFLYSR